MFAPCRSHVVECLKGVGVVSEMACRLECVLYTVQGRVVESSRVHAPTDGRSRVIVSCGKDDPGLQAAEVAVGGSGKAGVCRGHKTQESGPRPWLRGRASERAWLCTHPYLALDTPLMAPES